MDPEVVLKLVTDMKESLEREIQVLAGKLDHLEEKVDRRFDQVNSHLNRLDVVWKFK
jgi:hypothetical protein